MNNPSIYLKRTLVPAATALLCAAAAFAQRSPLIPNEVLISAWEHSDKVDIAPTVKEVGFNTIWTHDRAYDGYKLEDTLMYRHMNAPGVKYIIAKIERSVWGWNHQQSLAHADWIARVSLNEPRIIGVYLNDFYGEMDALRRVPEKPDPRNQGGRTDAQWREIIAHLRAGNPRLPIWLPCYPRMELDKPFDYDFDGIVCSFYGERLLPYADEVLSIISKKFSGKTIIAGVYLNSGTVRGWQEPAEYQRTLATFVKYINAGKIHGLRIFTVGNLQQRPEYAKWAREAIDKIIR
jgi:hypothetical protein